MTISTPNSPTVVVSMLNGKSDKNERGQWGSQVEFLLACIGYAVGLGNVWRFPYLCYENGGGVFLIPYVISLIVAGIPLFYLELCIGQFSSLGPNSVYGKLAPIFQGVGWAMVVLSFVVAIYYNMIIAWVVFYFFGSFRKELDWGFCTNTWNTALCQSNLEDQRCVTELGASTTNDVFFFNKTCYWANDTAASIIKNLTFSSNDTKMVSPAEEYFNNNMYGLTEDGVDGFSNLGGIQWKLVLCLLFAWIVVFLCLIKGVKSTGKVVYFTATFPYVVLIILLIRGVTLEGASLGIKYYLTPRFEKLLDINVWRAAATQIFYSQGLAFGSLLTMASYNKFKNNCYRDAVLVGVTNGCTSLFAGFAIFSTLGFMATDLGKDISEVVASGPSLAFIAYPEAIVRMPFSPLWSILFFFMLFTLGLDSQFAMVETITTAFMDQFPLLRKRKWAVVGTVCILLFLLGLPMCLQGGIYIFTIFDTYSGGYCLVLIALLEIVCVVYVYGLGAIMKDIQMMLGVSTSTIGRLIGPTSYFFKATWSVIAPFYILVILVFSFIYHSRTSYNDYTFPDGAEVFGWLLGSIPIVAIPVFAIYRIIINRLRNEPFLDLFRATSEWCPADERNRNVMQTFYIKAANGNISAPNTPKTPNSAFNNLTFVFTPKEEK